MREIGYQECKKHLEIFNEFVKTRDRCVEKSLYGLAHSMLKLILPFQLSCS